MNPTRGVKGLCGGYGACFPWGREANIEARNSFCGSCHIPFLGVKVNSTKIDINEIKGSAYFLFLTLRIDMGNRTGYAVLAIKRLFWSKDSPYNSKF